MTPGRATCAFCGEDVPVEDIFTHLREVHGFEEELERWPDGEPVILVEPDPEEFDA